MRHLLKSFTSTKVQMLTPEGGQDAGGLLYHMRLLLHGRVVDGQRQAVSERRMRMLTYADVC
jgi:hypothetical protein